MKASISALIDSVPWEKLEHAYGDASDVPPLLQDVAAVRGRKLLKALDELGSRVLHQGTIYSASPPVARAVIEMLREAAPSEKVMLYSLLAGFADAARKAIEDGRAIPCCAGGDPVDGAAIRGHLLEARDWFTQDLANQNDEIRSQAADLLVAFREAEPAASRLVRDRYFAESDPNVRHVLLNGMVRVRSRFDDWPILLTAALEHETDAANRFVLRYSQLREVKSAADSSILDELVSTFVQSNASHDYELAEGDRFFEAIHWLGSERELAAMLRAFELAASQYLLLVLAERLLRLAFEDQRTGWGQTRFSRLQEDGTEPPGPNLGKLLVRSIGLLILAKLFPFVLRRRLRQKAEPKGILKVEYSGLEGAAPSIPPRLSAAQRTILTAFAAHAALWEFRTNLWQLFGLPDNAEGLCRFLADR